MKLLMMAFCALLLLTTIAVAAPITYYANLSGPAEDPPNASPGVGSALVTIDTVAHTLAVSAQFSGLLGTTTASHIHAPTFLPFEGTASVATQTPSFIGFPLGVTAGSFSNTYDLTDAASFRAGFITSSGGTVETAEQALATALSEGRAYFNIHTSEYAGGEIRGFLQPVPEPSTAIGVAGVIATLAFVRRRRASWSCRG